MEVSTYILKMPKRVPAWALEPCTYVRECLTVCDMLRSFRSRALKRYWERGDTARLPSQDVARVRRILDLLDAAERPEDMAIPGYHFHALRADMKGRYAVTVRANWRITFGWDETDAIDVDLEDYH